VVADSAERPSVEEIEAALPQFLGDILQVPPSYSAIKVAGERAYDLARDGRPPQLEPRGVWIGGLELLECPDADHAVLAMTCGKGAYVRSLARDLGRALGCLGHVTALRRTRVGPFHEGNAISLDIVQELRHKDELDDLLLPVETALADIPALAVTGAEADRLKCGQAVRVPQKLEGTVYATTDGRPVALATVSDGEVRPVRVFNL
jgi:tRNA pseudouridine55 synthase